MNVASITCAVLAAMSLTALGVGCAPSVISCDANDVCTGDSSNELRGGEGGAGGSSGSNGGGGGVGGAPSAPSAVLYGTDPLTLRLATFQLTCAAPDSSPYGSCGWSTLQITFPASMLEAGFIDMSSPSINTFVSGADAAPAGDPGSCGGTAGVGGGGTWVGGVVTFTSIQDQSVTVAVSGFDDLSPFGNVDGTYTAPRCGP